MQSLHSLRQALPRDSSTLPPHRLSPSRQPTFTRSDIRKGSLFSQHPDHGPAVADPNKLHPEEPLTKRSELAQDPNLYLPKTDDANFYGRFITLGYHQTSGPINNPLRNKSERNKTFELWKRVDANGWKFKIDAASGHRATTVLNSATRQQLRTVSLNTPIQERTSTSIRVATLDRPDQLLVEYTLIPSSDHDLFQFGRDPYNNDFYIPGHTIEGHTWDPISRLAFRVQCSRTSLTDIRIAAAGFDNSNELFLGPYALRWGTQSQGGPQGGMDGGITVGLFLWKPKLNEDGTSTGEGEWYEISALGDVYHLRLGRLRGRKAVGVDNILTDGCIVVNATSVLLFTTVPPSKDNEYLTSDSLSARLEAIKDTLCPITYDHIPLRNAMISNVGMQPRNAPISPFLLDHSPPSEDSNVQRPGVFPACGHVFELPAPQSNHRLTSCPKCRVAGRMIPLLLQTAPTLLPKDAEFTHVLPCGHAMSEELGKRMSAMGLPTNDLLLGETEAKTWGTSLSGRRRRCWFCGGGFYPADLKRLYFERDG